MLYLLDNEKAKKKKKNGKTKNLAVTCHSDHIR